MGVSPLSIVHCPLSIGYWLLAIGYCLLSVDHCLSTAMSTGNKPVMKKEVQFW